MKPFRTSWLGQWILAILLLGSLLPAKAHVFICLCDASCTSQCCASAADVAAEPACPACCSESVVSESHPNEAACDGRCDTPCKDEHVTFHGIAKAIANAAPPSPPVPPASLTPPALLQVDPSHSIFRTSLVRLLNCNTDPPPPDWLCALQTSVMRT